MKTTKRTNKIIHFGIWNSSNNKKYKNNNNTIYVLLLITIHQLTNLITITETNGMLPMFIYSYNCCYFHFKPPLVRCCCCCCCCTKLTRWLFLTRSIIINCSSISTRLWMPHLFQQREKMKKLNKSSTASNILNICILLVRFVRLPEYPKHRNIHK